MSIADKLTQIAENQQKVFEAGKQAEYDRFWDAYQDNGNRTIYSMAFVRGWTDDIFNPKYDFILTTASQMFNSCTITTLASKLKQKGLKFDTSALIDNGAIQMFQGSRIRDIPELDLRGCTNISYIFGSTPSVETIEKLIISEKATTGMNSAFNGAYDLKHCLFDGVLATDGLTLRWCKLLDKESIVSLINILSTTTSGLAVTLSLEAVNKAFETSEGANDGSNSTEWQTLIKDKTQNPEGEEQKEFYWIISLV